MRCCVREAVVFVKIPDRILKLKGQRIWLLRERMLTLLQLSYNTHLCQGS